jgi:hypothetical protein
MTAGHTRLSGRPLAIGPKAFLAGVVLADTVAVRRRVIGMVESAWDCLRAVLLGTTPYEMGWTAIGVPVRLGRWRRLDWEGLRTTCPEHFDGIAVRSKVRFPTTSEEIVRFRVPLEVSVHAGRGMVRIVAHSYPPRDLPEGLAGEMAESLRALLTSWAGEGDVWTGLVTFDDAIGMLFPYEKAVGLPPSGVDWSRYVLGYYWGNLLTSQHLKRLARAGLEVPEGVVTQTGEGWMWVQLNQPSPRCDRIALQRMRAFLDPLLPPGRRTVEEYLATISDNEAHQIEALCV